MAEEMEAATASSDRQRLFQLIRNVGGRQTAFSDTVCNTNGKPIHVRWQRLVYWTGVIGGTRVQVRTRSDCINHRAISF